MINEKKNVHEFKKKYKIKEVNKDVLSKIIEGQGYTIIPYNRYSNSDKVSFLIATLGVGDYINSSCCFTYQNEKHRLVFLNNELSDDEAVIVLAHEEGHIWHNHVVSESVFGSDIKQEFEANEFAHYLLEDVSGRKKLVTKICIVTMLLVVVCGGAFTGYKISQDKRIYTDNYYRTSSGTKYHIEGCIYLKNKTDIKKLTKEEFESGNYEPCSVCVQFAPTDD